MPGKSVRSGRRKPDGGNSAAQPPPPEPPPPPAFPPTIANLILANEFGPPHCTWKHDGGKHLIRCIFVGPCKTFGERARSTLLYTYEGAIRECTLAAWQLYTRMTGEKPPYAGMSE